MTLSATSGRYVVLALMCSLSMITYLDRVCIGVAAPLIASDLGLESVTNLKWAFTSFFMAYAIFEIPTGWMGDCLGPRAMLIRIVLWWSACTALTGVVGLHLGSWVLGGLGTLILVRFLFGAGEAGAYPNITRALYNWFPPHEWEFAQSLVWMSGRLMGGVTPLLWMLLVTGTSSTPALVNWRGAFLGFGTVGIVWCIIFRIVFRNYPETVESFPVAVPSVPVEVSHQGIPWKWMLTHPKLLALCALYALVNYGWAFNITYLPGYLQQRFSGAESETLIAVYTGAPLWVGAFGCLSGGYCISLLDRRVRNRRLSRRILGMTAMLGCALCWSIARQADNLHVFCISVVMSAFCSDMTMGAIWATCQDIGRHRIAVAAAFMNTIGTLGGALAGWLTGSLVQQAVARQAFLEQVPIESLSASARALSEYHGFQFVFLTYLIVYLIAAGCWLLVRTHSPE